MFRRILLVIAATLTFIAPLSAGEPKPDGAVMKLLRHDGVQWGCGIGAALSWLICVASQRRFSRLSSSGYSQRQRRIALREQLDTLSRLIAQTKLTPALPVRTSSEEDVDALATLRQPNAAHQYMQKLDMLERQLGMVDQEINALNNKVSTANTWRQITLLSALALSGATIAPWCKKAPNSDQAAPVTAHS